MTLDPKAFKSLSRFLAPSAGGSIGDRALAENLISPAQLEECLREQDESGKPLDEILRRRALISDEDAARLRRSPLPPEVSAVAAEPARNLRQYVLVSMLGAGGMAEVWKAWDRTLSRWVAVKVLREEIGHGQARIEREGRTAGGLSHPNIIPIYEVGEHEGRPFLVMALVDGHPPRPPVPLEAAFRMAQQIASALDCVHQAGLIHRDVKPANIILEQGGRPLLADFGLAATQETSFAGGALSGTPQYASPEQLRGEPLDPRTDIYSLGATLFHLLAGHAPYPGRSSEEIAVAHRGGELPAFSRLPAKARAPLRKAMAIRREDRYASMAEFREALDGLDRGNPLLKKILVPATLLLAAALSSGLTYMLLLANRKSSDRQEALNSYREGSRLLGIAEQSLTKNRGVAGPESRAALSRALPEFFAALWLGSDHYADAGASLGRCYELLGNYERAEQAYEKAGEIPEARMGMARLGMRRFLAGWPGKDWKSWTLQQLSKVPAPSGSPTVDLIRAFCRADWPEALRAGAQAVEQEPVDDLGYLLLAWCAREASRPDEALKWVEAARRVRGQTPALLYQEALAFLAKGDKAEARRLLTLTVKLAEGTCTFLPDAQEKLRSLE